jgi:hypothetical protein
LCVCVDDSHDVHELLLMLQLILYFSCYCFSLEEPLLQAMRVLFPIFLSMLGE